MSNFGASAQSLPRVKPTPPPAAPASAASAAAPPVITLTADDIVSHVGGVTQASGQVDLKRLDIDLHADHLEYDQLADFAHAQGNVLVNRGVDWFTADRLDLELTRSAGTMTDTQYELGALKAGGHAQRIEVADRDHTTAFMADYSSCPRVPSAGPNASPNPDAKPIEPDWIITGDRIDIDTSTNEGKATHAVLHFLGVPILAAPSLTFPVTPERKSGWLPPTADFSTTSGLALAVPYYWNLEPNIDVTITPQVITKRGEELSGEVRYYEPDDLGQLTGTTLPYDKVTGYSRGSLEWAHEGVRGDWLSYSARVERVSDNLYWKDFPHETTALTKRLLTTDLSGTRRYLPFGDDGEIDTYARVQRFQTLQDYEDPSAKILSPYQRSPQVGLRGNLTAPDRVRFDLETEVNRFDLSNKLPDPSSSPTADNTFTDGRFGATRAHMTASVTREFTTDWGRFAPKLSVNGATYHYDHPIDGQSEYTRWIPTFSADSSFSFERQATLFGHDLLQTLEPRFLYVLTPYRNQTNPLYDSAPKDFNEVSIYSDNDFTGIDHISDEDQLTAGATTRYNDAVTGRELLRLGLAQKFLFKDQRLTADGDTNNRNISDLLLWGSASAMEHWSFDGTLELDPSSGFDSQRAIISTRYHPGPFKSLSLTYRYARDSSEQYEVAGQWPIYRRPPSANGCGGTLYAVGRMDYSVTDSRATYSLGGFEYDAGCWIGRLMVERTSTGRNESTTHVVLQLELNGLSTLGTGSTKLLKDNVPGYEALRNDPGTTPDITNPQ